MIVNLWKNTSFYCMNHDKPVKMEPRTGKKELFYACPKYYPENRSDNERACMNNMYTQDAQEAVCYVSDKIEQYTAEGIEPLCVIGETWTKRDIDYTVLNYDNGKLKIGVLNRRALSKIR